MKNEHQPSGSLQNARVIENETVVNTLRKILADGKTPDGGVHVLAAIAADHATSNEGVGQHCIFAIQVGSKRLELEENIEERLCRATEDLRQEFRSGEVVEQGFVDCPQDLDPKGRKVTLLYTTLSHSGETVVQLSGALMDLACSDTERGASFREMMGLGPLLARIDREIAGMEEAVVDGNHLKAATDAMMAGIKGPPGDMQGLTESLNRRLGDLTSVFEAMKEIRETIATDGVTIETMCALRDLVLRCETILKVDKDTDPDIEAEIQIKIEGLKGAEPPAVLMELLGALMKRQAQNRQRLNELEKLARCSMEKANSWDAIAEAINDSDPGIFEAEADDCDIILDWVKESVRVREHFIKTVANPDEANNAETLNKTSAGE